MANEYAFLYTEINIFCIILTLIVYIRSGGYMRLTAHRVFRGAVISMIIFMLADNAAFMIVHGGVRFSVNGVLFFKTLYFLATTIMCCFWYIYFECMREPVFWEHRLHLIFLTIPLAVQLVLEAVNWRTGFFFAVEDGVYRRGELFVLQYIFAYGYVLVAIVRALRAGGREKNYVDRDRVVSIALFPVFPAVAGLLQFFFPNLPLACAAVTLSLMILYFYQTDSMISVDPLTKLNNRRVLMYNISRRMRDQAERDGLYLLMIDGDKFKSINDTYGHIEGDKALVRIAEALKRACGDLGRRPTIARFGGDEFVVVASLDSEEMLRRLCADIGERLEELNEESGAAYRLTVSIGAARYSDSIKTVREFIAKADEQLYMVKKNRKRS